ncbi:hypothetical protein [Amycolatopsis balhimycina]|uniref:hypothetical protein n=1 Tax=Amycolatopsis balhimycina TaxID=208443 RepID=UPI000F77A0A9|nr:hypothetical protein [Amycolatopsis balhimycina]
MTPLPDESDDLVPVASTFVATTDNRYSHEQTAVERGHHTEVPGRDEVAERSRQLRGRRQSPRQAHRRDRPQSRHVAQQRHEEDRHRGENPYRLGIPEDSAEVGGAGVADESHQRHHGDHRRRAGDQRVRRGPAFRGRAAVARRRS